MQTPYTPQWLLRRLAARGIRVHDRQQGKSAALAVFTTTLPVYCATYIEYYDALRQLAKVHINERFEGKQSIVALIKVLRIWAPLLARDIRGVREGEFGQNSSVPDDIIRDTKELLRYANEHRDEAGEPLSYLDALIAEVTPVLEAAEKEWGEAEEAVQSYSTMRDLVHLAGVALEKELVSYRKILKAVIGRTNADYQKLRVDRAGTPDEDDDEVAAALPEELEGAEVTPVVPDPQPGEEAQPSP